MFRGFDDFGALLFTEIPNLFFDEILVRLNFPETRVLLYLFRHTLREKVSISQMIDGTVDKTRGRLDYGTGLDRKALLSALRSLEKKRLIDKIYDGDENEGPVRALYGIRWEEKDRSEEIPTLPVNKTERTKAGYIYVIKANDRYKIGRCKNGYSRINIHAESCPYPTELIIQVRVPNHVAAERGMHEYFASSRVKGEWFILTDGELEELKASLKEMALDEVSHAG